MPSADCALSGTDMSSRSRPLHIAHITPSYFSPDSYVGGGERYVDYIVRSLSSFGRIKQCVFAFGTEDSLFERGGTPIRVLQNESSDSGPTNAFSAALWRELRGFDLVHIHQALTPCGAYSLAIVRSLGIPAVGTDLGGGEHTVMIRGRAIELLDGVISISEYARSLIDSYYSGPHEVLIGPVDTNRFTPGNRTRDPRKVLCVSRIMPHKGIDRVVAALPADLSLTIAGHIYHQEYYERLRQMAQGKDVQFILDPADDALLELYQTSALFAQASTTRDIFGNPVTKSELMGLTTLEAMACGLPVVVSDTGSLPELVKDTRFGRLFQGHDDLCDILRSFAMGVWPKHTAGSLAREYVVNAHGMNAIAQRLFAFYQSILPPLAQRPRQ